MKAITAALGAFLLFATAAHAADAEGTIAKVDKATMTLTLEGGESFKLSEEFVVEDYTAGMAVMISYAEIKGEKIVLQIIPE